MCVSFLTVMIVPLECVDVNLKSGIENIESDGGSTCVDVNVNMVKQWWGMENNRFFHFFDRNKGTHISVYWIYANLLHNFGCNGVIFLLLKGLLSGFRARSARLDKGGNKTE